MKRFPKSILGMTIIEIMVFLGIVAGIVVLAMYYLGMFGSASQADDVLEKVRGLNSAVANLQSTGNVSPNSLTTETLSSMLPPDGLTTPWGEKMMLAGTSSDSYTINIPMMPAAICSRIMQVLSTNTRYDLSSTRCPEDQSATVSFTYTYYTSQQDQ